MKFDANELQPDIKEDEEEISLKKDKLQPEDCNSIEFYRPDPL
jgi:hypothetical protein